MVLINNNTRLLSCIIERPSVSTDKQSTFHIVWKVDFNQPCPSHHDGILTGEPPLLCLCCCQREAASWIFFFFFTNSSLSEKDKNTFDILCVPPLPRCSWGHQMADSGQGARRPPPPPPLAALGRHCKWELVWQPPPITVLLLCLTSTPTSVSASHTDRSWRYAVATLWYFSGDWADIHIGALLAWLYWVYSFPVCLQPSRLHSTTTPVWVDGDSL